MKNRDLNGALSFDAERPPLRPRRYHPRFAPPRSGNRLLRAQDVLPLGTQDAEILSWAAAEGRVLISNDRNTMVGLAYQRAAAGDPAPGLIATTNNRSARPLTTSCSSRSTCRRTRSNSKS